MNAQVTALLRMDLRSCNRSTTSWCILITYVLQTVCRACLCTYIYVLQTVCRVCAYLCSTNSVPCVRVCAYLCSTNSLPCVRVCAQTVCRALQTVCRVLQTVCCACVCAHKQFAVLYKQCAVRACVRRWASTRAKQLHLQPMLLRASRLWW